MKKKVKKPKLTAPKEPKKPRKPQKPEEPKEMIVSSGTINIYDGMSLQEIIDYMPENVDISKTKLTLELDYMDCYYNYDNPGIEGYFTYTSGLVKNPHYKRQLTAYNKKIKTYEKKLKEYEAAMKEYEKDFEQYKKEKEIFDKVLAQREIERLESELSILRGMC